MWIYTMWINEYTIIHEYERCLPRIDNISKASSIWKTENYQYSTAVHVYVRLTSTEFNIVAPLDLGRFAQWNIIFMLWIAGLVNYNCRLIIV